MTTSYFSEATLNEYKVILASIDSEIHIANSESEVKEIEIFRDHYYKNIYPLTYNNKPDPYYRNGIHCCIKDQNGNIVATLSFAFENKSSPLPDERFFRPQISDYKARGVRHMEVGRMLVAEENRQRGLAKKLFRFMYFGACAIGIDKIVTLYKTNGLSFVEEVIGTETIIADTGENFGGKNNYAAIVWDIKNTLPAFFDWLNKGSPVKKTKQSEMDAYSRCQYSLTTSFQMDVYRNTSKHMKGRVLDIGCGSGKMLPWLADNPLISGYLGVDISKPMLAKAKGLLKKSKNSTFSVIHSDINNVQESGFDSALSICSYQFWKDQAATLTHIASLLKAGATLVLATPNQNQDLVALSKEVRKEQPGHPDLEAFIEHNMKLEGTTTRFSEADEVLMHAGNVGLKLKQFHNQFYLGGMDYFVFTKK